MLINFFSQLWYTLSLKTLLSFQVLYSLINASISGNDFESAIKVLIQPIGWFTNRTTIRFKFQGHPFGPIFRALRMLPARTYYWVQSVEFSMTGLQIRPPCASQRSTSRIWSFFVLYFVGISIGWSFYRLNKHLRLSVWTCWYRLSARTVNLRCMPRTVDSIFS